MPQLSIHKILQPKSGHKLFAQAKPITTSPEPALHLAEFTSPFWTCLLECSYPLKSRAHFKFHPPHNHMVRSHRS